MYYVLIPRCYRAFLVGRKVRLRPSVTTMYVCGTKPRNKTARECRYTNRGGSQDYGGVAYTTTSEPENHMNDILRLARGLTP